MSYTKKELKNGITVHNIKTEKFKTNIISIFLTTPLSREFVTFDSLLASVLRRGSKNMPSQEQISKTMEEMYGARFNCGIDKTGDNHIIKFYIESINNDYLPQNEENMLKASFEKLSELVFDPYIENGTFKEEYVLQEKENMKQKIEAKVDNKAAYAKARCVEEMYKGEPAGLYRFGYTEDLEKISSQNLYEYYKKLIGECKIDIFVSGNISQEETMQIVEENGYLKVLNPRNANYIINNIELKSEVEEKYVEEKKDVTQGKLVIGCDIRFDEEDLKNKNIKYHALVYNNLLGGSANSKLFQNVREKASLAYTANSNYVRFKSNIYINAGIEIENYDKALKIIKEQLLSLQNGNFTEEDIQNEKKVILSYVNQIADEQDTELMYYFGQELINSNETIEDYKNGISNVTKDELLNIASKVKINTIYFLRN